jgi:N-acetylglucosamine kinase-like BadF-type ATPase
LATLAPVVVSAADADATAERIVHTGAQELARAAEVVVNELRLMPSPVPFAIAGGLLLANEGYRQRVLKSIQEAGVSADPITLVPEPAEGAVKMALTRRQS